MSGPPTPLRASRQAVGVAVEPTPWQLSVGVPALPVLVPTSAPQVPSPNSPLSHQVRRCQVPCQLEIKYAQTWGRAHPRSSVHRLGAGPTPQALLGSAFCHPGAPRSTERAGVGACLKASKTKPPCSVQEGGGGQLLTLAGP